MAIRTEHSIQKGIHRLLHAPQDVPATNRVPWRDPPLHKSQATEGHRELFEEYKTWLEGAVGVAVERWEDMIQTRTGLGASTADAREDLYERNLAGPAACPELMWTLREYWLRCDAINKEASPDRRVAPQVFLLAWVIEEGTLAECVQVMTAMPYWPIGLDDKGEWV